MHHKAGFVNIIGHPNAGKSTLMNALIGESLSIVTPKKQTTRHRIIGIVNGKDFQITYSDTPGIIKPSYKLHLEMMNTVFAAISDADILLFVTDVRQYKVENNTCVDKVKKCGIPVFVILNKIDTLVENSAIYDAYAYWKTSLPLSEIIGISALKNTNIELLIGKIIAKLPEAPPYYPKDQFTDRPERFFVAELIRESIFINYRQEIPYSCEVQIQSFSEKEKIFSIDAVIYVMKESQKIILIGNKGNGIKQTGTLARKKIENFLNKKVFLSLVVKTSKNWRDDERKLKQFGYVTRRSS